MQHCARNPFLEPKKLRPSTCPLTLAPQPTWQELSSYALLLQLLLNPIPLTPLSTRRKSRTPLSALRSAYHTCSAYLPPTTSFFDSRFGTRDVAQWQCLPSMFRALACFRPSGLKDIFLYKQHQTYPSTESGLLNSLLSLSHQDHPDGPS